MRRQRDVTAIRAILARTKLKSATSWLPKSRKLWVEDYDAIVFVFDKSGKLVDLRVPRAGEGVARGHSAGEGSPVKFLTVCEGGVVRSGAMAFQLKSAGQDAVQASWRWNSAETFRYLLEWCDHVVLMQAEFSTKIPGGLEAFQHKVLVVDVGPDVYGNPLHMGLNVGLHGVVKEWAAKGWKLP